MVSIHCNSHIKLWKNGKEFANNITIKPFINKYNCKEINYPSGKDNWKKCEENCPIMPLNELYIKNGYIFCLHFKTQLKLWKRNHPFNDSKWRTIALSCSEKTQHY